MPQLLLADILEVTSYCRTQSGQNVCNVFHYRVADVAAPNPDLQLALNALAVEMESAFDQVNAQNTDFLGIKGMRIAPNPTQLFNAAVQPSPGSLVGDVLPTNVAPLLSVRSSVAPKRTRSRKYLPPPTEAQNTAMGAVDPVFTVTMGGAFAPLLLANLVLNVGGGTLSLRAVIWKKSNNTSYDIDQVIPRTFFATQDRRRGSSQPDAPPF
jgi:hypothetical protein